MATGQRGSSPTEPTLPQNTIIVMPKSPPLNRTALWLVFWGIGLVMGLFLRSLLDGPAPQWAEADNDTAVARAAAPAPTLEINVRAIVEIPTETPTPFTVDLKSASTLTPTINDCTSSAEPGKICQVPFPPQPTATPYPSCLQMDELTPGAWCMWPAASPTPGWWAGSS